jgi:uncharacterized protein YggE
MQLFEGSEGARIQKAVFWVVIVLGVFLAIEALSSLEGLRYIGSGVPPTNTISVSGHGEFLAVPDIAQFSFSVVSDKPTVAQAQADATAKINAITAYLKSAGIDEKDIQTSDYSIYPQYDYQSAVCPQPAVQSGNSASAIYCPPGRQVLKGYEVRQMTTVKVHDTGKAGELLSGVGSKGATEVSGLTFTFEDPDAPKTQARDKAIADAKQKAEVLAKQLGVHLVRVVSFQENGGGYPTPIYYKAADGMGGATAQSAPEISTGQNKITDDVTITYEIR